MAEHVFGIVKLLVDGVVVAMGIADYQNHWTPPSWPVKS